MKACILSALDTLRIEEIANLTASAGEAVVSLKAAALNHRDVWIKQGQYAGVKYPSILGSDGAGLVLAVGSGDGCWVNQEVIINPSFSWGPSEGAQSADFSILGLPRNGTFAEQIVVPFSQLTQKPADLSWTEAAALPLAGLTAYRAVFARANLQAGERVLISGVGGGVALFALQFAIAAGARVWVTSSSPAKISKAVALGANGGFDYTKTGWAVSAAKTVGHFDVIIDSAGGPGFEALVDLAAPGGRIAFFGATRGNPPTLPMRKIFWRQLSLLGTTMGSAKDWNEMVGFSVRHRVRPVVSEVFPFHDVAQAFALMERGDQFGKIVVSIP